MENQFKLHIKYVSMLRYIPHKLLNKICSGIELHDIYMLLDDELDLELDLGEDLITESNKSSLCVLI